MFKWNCINCILFICHAGRKVENTRDCILGEGQKERRKRLSRTILQSCSIVRVLFFTIVRGFLRSLARAWQQAAAFELEPTCVSLPRSGSAQLAPEKWPKVVLCSIRIEAEKCKSGLRSSVGNFNKGRRKDGWRKIFVLSFERANREVRLFRTSLNTDNSRRWIRGYTTPL